MELKLTFREVWLSLIAILMFPIASPALNPRKPEIAARSAEELFRLANESLEHRNSPDSALYYLAALTSMSENDGSDNVSPDLFANAYNATGAIYASVYGNYSTAALNLLKALDIARQSKSHELENQILYNLAVLEYEQGSLTSQADIRKKTFDRFVAILNSLDFESAANLVYSLTISSAGLAIRSNQGDVGKLINQFKKAKHLSPELKEIYNLIVMLNDHDYDGIVIVVDTIASNLMKSESIHSQNCLAEAMLIRADALLMSGNENAAMHAYRELAERSNKRGDMFRVFEIYSFLNEYFEKKGDIHRALQFEIKELRSKDSLVNRSRTLSLEGSRALYNEDKLKREITSEMARAKTYKIVMAMSVVFLSILLLLLSVLYRKLKQLKQSRNIIVRNDIEHFRHELTKPDSDDKTLDDSKDKRVFDKVMDAIKNSEEIYEEDFNTGRLAALVKEKPSVVSAAIMASTGETTTQFLARIRIREACRRINDLANYGGYTIEAIGQSVGYRSRSHFGSVFKKTVGMTPSEYSAKIRNSSEA